MKICKLISNLPINQIQSQKSFIRDLISAANFVLDTEIANQNFMQTNYIEKLFAE